MHRLKIIFWISGSQGIHIKFIEIECNIGLERISEMTRIDEDVKSQNPKNYSHQHTDIIRSRNTNRTIFRPFTRESKIRRVDKIIQ